MQKVENNWDKSDSAFEDQLKRNLSVIDNKETWPPTWHNFLAWAREFSYLKTIHDIGCGSAIYFELCRKFLNDREYIGYDFAKKAITLCNEAWNGKFIQASYEDIKIEDPKNSIIVSNALTEVVPDGLSCLQKLLSFNTPVVILQRQILTNKETYITTYGAYDIEISSYHMNYDVFGNTIANFEYHILDMLELPFRTNNNEIYYDICLVKNKETD
jgi:hypothetical protein